MSCKKKINRDTQGRPYSDSMPQINIYGRNVTPISDNEAAIYGTQIIVIDSCEYFSDQHGGITHLGNCRNPIHKR